MVKNDNVLSDNFDARKLSKEELNEALAIIRKKIISLEKQRASSDRSKGGPSKAELDKKINRLNQLLKQVRLQLLLTKWFK